MTDLIDLGPEFLKWLASSVLVTAFAWGIVEWALFRLPDEARRIAALLLGQAMLGLAHYGDLVSFGKGPQGWALAALFGLMGGALAPAFHDRVMKRYAPWLTKSGGGS